MIHSDFFGVEQIEEENDEDRKIYGVTVGQVINLADPMAMGRVQVRIHSIDSADLAAWARIATPMAGVLHGSYLVPHIGDEVLLAFEHGDPNVPYIVGSVHNVLDLPPIASPFPEIRGIRTISGNQIVFSEFTESVTIQTGPTPPEILPSPPTPTGPYQSIMMGPGGIQVMTPQPVTIISPTAITLQVGASTVVLSAAGVVISGPQVTIGGGANVTVAAGTVLIN